MLILDIDPDFAIVGFGLVEADRGRQRLMQCDTTTTPTGEPLPTRLRQIADDMDLLLVQFQPQAMAVEKLLFSNSITMDIGVAQARGIFLLAAERRGVPVFKYTPSQVKQAVVGYGRAERRQVTDVTRRLLSLSAVPEPGGTADAVATALFHIRSFTFRLQGPDMARPGNGRYEMRRQVRWEKQKQCFTI